ncbi:hypothetical protein BLNAU_14461 [Blattamonas nauphoetae]|uniref:Uncharacterized protein n=1 Tax=Blattamonas nauphoetae TaxID=2049346 RepID=A0ABQ9XFV7_9EUKA|nr:hypothetical protein BLNAU_14461 [Blattamonas nauphoetae]
MESALEWLSDSSVHPRNKVNSFQWFHIPTLLTTHIQSQQEQPTKQNNEVLSQLLQRMMTILDECFDSHTPIANKRLLHSSLSQLSQSPSLDPKIKRGVGYCFVALDSVDEGPFVVVPKEQLESMEAAVSSFSELQQKHDELPTKLVESERKNGQLEKEKEKWTEERKTHLSTIQSLQKEMERIQRKKDQHRNDLESKVQKLEENERVIGELNHTIDQLKFKVPARPQSIVASNVIVAFSPDHFRVRGSTVTRINSGGWAGCFTKPVSKGIHRLSLITKAEYVHFGVIDAAEYPKFLISAVWRSPKAALMQKSDGKLWSAGKSISLNDRPQNGQEWSAEADLAKRTLHFFIDGVQQPHHFINIPVSLVFANDILVKDTHVEITFWGETQSHVTFQGSGHNLG